MEKPEFQKFERIPRLFRDCVITEKLDGTNGLVYVGEDGSVLAGSRNRWITPEDDNYSFAQWVAHHADELRQLGPGFHYGEWWGEGIARRYAMSEKRWSLFNVGRWGDGGKDADKLPKCCHVVPVLLRGGFNADDIHTAIEKLRTGGSVASPGFMNPEGVVVWHEAAQKAFKFTLDGDGHKTAKARAS
jgi:hypothetical protein